MRFTILMTIAVCYLTIQFNQCVQLLRPVEGKPICTQPPVTRAEIEAGLAAREELLRREAAMAEAWASTRDAL